MNLIADLKSLEPSQRSAIWASYLGWTLDAFDFFLMVFMLSAIAKEFGTDVKAVSYGIFLTLAARPIGAFCFGWLAEHFGRRPVLMADIVLFSIFEFASGFAPSLTSLLIRMHVKESPVFEARRGKAVANPIMELVRHWKIALYLVVLMTAFNFFSHGTQDLYPTFLQKQHHFDTHTTGILAAVMNLGAIVGGITFGIWSERIGRKRAIIIASLLAL